LEKPYLSCRPTLSIKHLAHVIDYLSEHLAWFMNITRLLSWA
jgi:hypothetical protein